MEEMGGVRLRSPSLCVVFRSEQGRRRVRTPLPPLASPLFVFVIVGARVCFISWRSLVIESASGSGFEMRGSIVVVLELVALRGPAR